MQNSQIFQICKRHAHVVKSTSSMNAVEFKRLLGKNRRAFIIHDPNTGEFNLSDHNLVDILGDFSNKEHALGRDFHQHEGIFVEVGQETGAIHSAFIHKTTRGNGQGGLRYWHYNNITEYFSDGLRLSRGMGHKNALAGLWWGGGKGLIWREPNHPHNDRKFRDTLFQEYGSFITSLQGCYITAEDVGVNVDDMEQIFHKTRYATCIPQKLGGSGNPSTRTGQGVVKAMEGALEYNNDTFANKSIAIQGYGNVSQSILKELLKNNNEKKIKKIIISDMNEINIEKGNNFYKSFTNNDSNAPKIEFKHVSINDNSILFENVDIISPCAIGGILNSNTIPNIKAKYIIGAANNQLLNDYNDDYLLKKYNKIYVPDFLANRMGIVNCCNEQYGYVNNDPDIVKHLGKSWDNSVYTMTQKILNRAHNEDIPTGQAAKKTAEELMEIKHPIWGHRGWNIIQSLVENKWHQQLQRPEEKLL